ncbi:hypothetical protein Tco_1153499 [Tanacetum coccineum]
MLTPDLLESLSLTPSDIYLTRWQSQRHSLVDETSHQIKGSDRLEIKAVWNGRIRSKAYELVTQEAHPAPLQMCIRLSGYTVCALQIADQFGFRFLAGVVCMLPVLNAVGIDDCRAISVASYLRTWLEGCYWLFLEVLVFLGCFVYVIRFSV